MSQAGEVIGKCGGVVKLAKMLELNRRTVQSWKDRNSIPARRQRQILEATRACGISLSADDFFGPIKVDQAA